MGRDDLPVRLRVAHPGEGRELQEIAVASKAHWGYDLAWVRQWAGAGDFSPAGLREKEVVVAEVSGSPVGWSALIPRGDVCWLEDLWVRPEWIGKSVGTFLFRRATERAAELGASRLEWEADPNAVGFYERMGGRYVRDSEPTELGRVIPVMALDLAPHRA
jgi:GNAT superfamily N-acetyltransferase